MRALLGAVLALHLVLNAAACTRGNGGRAEGTGSATTPSLASATAAVAPPRSLGEIRQRLQVDAQRLDPCGEIRDELSSLDAFLDREPRSVEGFQLLGEALQLASEACSASNLSSRHATRAEDAFAAASARRAVDAGASPPLQCSAGQGLAEGQRLEAAQSWAEAAAAYRRELYGGCESRGLQWQGAKLLQRGAARLGLARAALEAGDTFEARRELRRLELDRAESTLHLGNPAQEQALWQRLGPAPRAKPVRAARPEQAIAALERAAIEDDAASFDASIATTAPERKVLAASRDDGSTCGKYAGVDPTLLRSCLLAELLPEAPRAVTCGQARAGRATCLVTGATPGQARSVALVDERGAWKIAESSAP
jgi:hypothetical protein